MTAPTPTARATPGGRKLGDGFPITITFSLDPDLEIHEKEITPAGLEGDDLLDTSNQHNSQYRTKSPRSLITMTDCTITCYYDPVAMTSIEAMINKPQTITETMPDGSTICYYGVIKSFMRGAMSEGTVPTATITVVPTNQDPTTCTEEGPVYTPGTGTAPSC